MALALLGCVGFVALAVCLWVVSPESMPIALVTILFFGGGGLPLLRHGR